MLQVKKIIIDQNSLYINTAGTKRGGMAPWSTGVDPELQLFSVRSFLCCPSSFFFLPPPKISLDGLATFNCPEKNMRNRNLFVRGTYISTELYFIRH